MRTIKEILIKRDGLSADEADELILEAKEDFEYCLAQGDMDGAENICEVHFGLEPDYLEEFF